MKPFQVYLLIAVVIIGFYAGLAYTLDQQVVAEHERGFNDEQARQVLTAVSNLEAHHENIAHTFTLVSQYAIGGYLEDMVSRPLFEQILNTISNDVNHERLVVSYYTEPGVYELGYVQPTPLGDAARALADDWAVEYWDTVEQIDTYITTPFVATPEAQLYGLVFPTYELFPRSFAGVLVVVLDYRPVIERYIAPLRSGTYGAAWVHNSDGVVIYDHEPSEIGRGLDDISAGYPDLQRLLRTTLEQEAGRGEYHYTLTVGGKVVRKLVAWNTAYLFGQRITVAMSAPDTEINASLGVFRLQSVALGGLLGLSLIASGAVFYMTRQRELKRVVAARTQELETMTHELQALTGQLDQRVRERTVELDHERAQLAAILDAMSDGLVYHENHRVKYVNAAFTRLLGYTAEEMIGQSADFQREMVDSEEDLQRARQRYEQHRASPDLVNIPWSYELKMKRKDGTCFDAALTSVPICNPQGERLGGAEVFRDVSEQKALQDQKDSFITNASHELRRPLTNLKVRTYLLYQQPDQLETHLPLIERAGDEMATLVQSLMDVTHLQSTEVLLEPKPLVIQDMLNQALGRIRDRAEQRHVTLVNALPTTPVYVRADYQWLIASFSHLLTNVLAYSKEDGQITLNLSTHQNSVHTWAVIRVQGGSYHLEPEQLAHIFDPFSLPSEGSIQNTGLELTIARRVIEHHGGEITVESAPDIGTVFTVRLITTSMA